MAGTDHGEVAGCPCTTQPSSLGHRTASAYTQSGRSHSPSEWSGS